MVAIFATNEIKNTQIKSISDQRIKKFDLALNNVLLNLAKRVVSDGEGATKLLGLSLTPLEILLRETLQNSWGASIEQKTKPSFEINLRLLKSSESSALKNFFNEFKDF